MSKVIRRLWSIGENFFSNLLGYQLTYIVEACDWSIKNDGQSIARELNKQGLLRARISYSTIGLRNQIIHFGSVNTFFRKEGWQKPHVSNILILTWFHVVPNDNRLKLIKNAQHNLRFIHTSCTSTKRVLVDAGADEHKIVVIPLGVDRALFTPVDQDKKRAARHQFGIPQNRLVIGSFQKDGIGWGEGLEPKLIKGPDIFAEVMARIKNLNPFILLTGPARGYIKHALEKQGVEYKHIYVKNFQELPALYHTLDVYLITSRIEGGPKSLLEAWASGVPVISTRVGMVPDIAKNGQTVILSEANASQLAEHTAWLLHDHLSARRLAQRAQENVYKYDWNTIVRQYQNHIYSKCSV